MAIIGKLDSLEPLFSKTVELEALYAYLKSMLNANHPHHKAFMQAGSGSFRYELEHGMYAMQIAYKPSKGVFETHRMHVDFLLIVQGCEILELGDRSDFVIQDAYDSAQDKETYSNNDRISEVCMRAGCLAVLFPYDVHTTSAHPQSPDLVQKVVAKVPTHLIKLKL